MKKLFVLVMVVAFLAVVCAGAQAQTLEELDARFKQLVAQKVEIEKEMLRIEGQYRERGMWIQKEESLGLETDLAPEEAEETD